MAGKVVNSCFVLISKFGASRQEIASKTATSHIRKTLNYSMRELSLHNYIEHLRSIQNRLENFISEFERGNRDYIQDIALKLRILFIHKSGTKALFTTIQTLFGVQIRVWVRESRDEELKRKG